jgi:hypothetical protein
MPKRTTILYTSSDGLKGAAEDELIVYYCKFSGRHAFTTGAGPAAARASRLG